MSNRPKYFAKQFRTKINEKNPQFGTPSYSLSFYMARMMNVSFLTCPQIVLQTNKSIVLLRKEDIKLTSTVNQYIMNLF